MLHIARFCSSKLRCRSCFGYGHLQRFCLARLQRRKHYRQVTFPGLPRVAPSPQKPVSPEVPDSSVPLACLGAGSVLEKIIAPDLFPSPEEPSPLPLLETAPSPPCLPVPVLAMANFPVDPSAFLPRGFKVKDVLFPGRRPKRLRSHVGSSCRRLHEDVGIAVLVPAVATCDFPHMADALHHYLTHSFKVRVLEIAACPIGAAFVTFGSCLE